MFSLANKRVMVTGGAGFLGQHLCRQLLQEGVAKLVVPLRQDYDLTQAEDVRRAYDTANPEVVFHLAAEVGGIGANQQHPGRFFFANMAMGMNLIEEGRKRGLEKFIQTGTICAYPKFTPVPFREENLWNGYPEETNAPYGIAKKALQVMLAGYFAEYGFPGVYVLPVNLYGPGDNFHPETSHVIPALIRKCIEAREGGADTLRVWGSGSVSREFLYVEDCARGLVLAAKNMVSPEPVNLGTGREIQIVDLAWTIAELCNFHGKLEFDKEKPDGQPRRSLDLTRARERLGFKAQVTLEEGLKRTIAWFEEARRTGTIREVIYGSESPT